MIIMTIISFIIAIAIPSIQISPINFTRISSISLLMAGLLSFHSLNIENLTSGLNIYSQLFEISSISLSIDIFIYLIGGLILIPWFISDINKKVSIGPVLSEYSLIILFSILGSTLLLSSNDLISMYISIELQSFAVYILATIYRDSESATAAGLKYFLLGGLSSCFILLGSALIYTFTGLTNIHSIFNLLINISFDFNFDNLNNFNFDNNFYSYLLPLLGLALIISGFLFKIAAAPLHHWAPSVYNDVPTIVTTWLTIMPKIAIFIFLLGLLNNTIIEYLDIDNINNLESNNIYDPIKNLILFSSFLSLIIGTVAGLSQFKIKRLLRI